MYSYALILYPYVFNLHSAAISIECGVSEIIDDLAEPARWFFWLAEAVGAYVLGQLDYLIHYILGVHARIIRYLRDIVAFAACDVEETVDKI